MSGLPRVACDRRLNIIQHCPGLHPGFSEPIAELFESDRISCRPASILAWVVFLVRVALPHHSPYLTGSQNAVVFRRNHFVQPAESVHAARVKGGKGHPVIPVIRTHAGWACSMQLVVRFMDRRHFAHSVRDPRRKHVCTS